ncbi:ATP-binding protein [Streptomyces sp. NBC_00557]|nr:ATP-binding protein [Streptomyces sp. NBC_00557]
MHEERILLAHSPYTDSDGVLRHQETSWHVDLLCLDEFGYLDLDKTGAKLLFQVFTEREERRAIAIASNAPFSEWKQTFTDPRLCSAIVDRVRRQG